MTFSLRLIISAYHSRESFFISFQSFPIDTSAKIGTPEIYFGASRNTALAIGRAQQVGSQILFEPAAIEPNKLYLAGEWFFDKEFARNQNAPAKITIRYQAQDVYFVAAADTEIKIRLRRDGQKLSGAAGVDVEDYYGDAYVTVKAERLYKLIEDKTGYGQHTLELLIEQPGLKAFTFTFG